MQRRKCNIDSALNDFIVCYRSKHYQYYTSMSLHLLQLSMVYINMLMIQQIIEEHGLKDILTKEDKRALTPLIYEHVNPYGLFPLDLSTRLPHLHYKAAA